jgi:CRP-like cAMP-binding protein
MVARRMLANLSIRLHRLIRDTETAAMNSATERVARFLLRHVPAESTGAPVTIRLETSKLVAASRLNLSPEAFSRALRRLTDAGELHVRGRAIVINDPAGLARQQDQSLI